MAPDDTPLRLGDRAPDFTLPGTDGRTWRLADALGTRATCWR
jgi:peroxiredoxin